MKKRILATLLAGVMLLSLAACGGKKEEAAAPAEDAAVEESAEEESAWFRRQGQARGDGLHGRSGVNKGEHHGYPHSSHSHRTKTGSHADDGALQLRFLRIFRRRYQRVRLLRLFPYRRLLERRRALCLLHPGGWVSCRSGDGSLLQRIQRSAESP